MRDYLIGYLLDALEPSEQELVEARLSSDPGLRRDLEVLSRGIEPLNVDKAHHRPPAGLAHRTCQFVAAQTKTAPAPPVVSVPSRWSMADLAVAAGIFLAATLLFFPAMNQSRFAARLTGCQYNLGQLGVALDNYSTRFPNQFPAASLQGNMGRAGAYAILLQEHGLLAKTHILICPASPLADRLDEFRVPTVQEMMQADGEQLAALRQQIKGIYGYNLGFIANGRYHPPARSRSATWALMADTPSPNTPMRSSLSHGGCGQNVLFGDMHVQFLKTCKAKGCNDHIFVNDDGQARAGLHPRDSVIGGPDDCPFDVSDGVLQISPGN